MGDTETPPGATDSPGYSATEYVLNLDSDSTHAWPRPWTEETTSCTTRSPRACRPPIRAERESITGSCAQQQAGKASGHLRAVDVRKIQARAWYAYSSMLPVRRSTRLASTNRLAIKRSESFRDTCGPCNLFDYFLAGRVAQHTLPRGTAVVRGIFVLVLLYS